jgi:prephenate dehydrogenase
MDVGSTKRDVVDAARRALKDRIGAFVPAHPIAGKELSGVQHADAQLYREQQVILTPCPDPAGAGREGPRPLGRPGCAGARDDAGGA